MAWVAVAIGGSALIGAVASNKASNAASEANQNAIEANKWQGEIAQEQWQRYKNTYAPLEDGMVADAQNFDSPEAQARAAGDANMAVQSQFGRARQRLMREGADPSSAGYQANMAGLELAQAATGAQAQNAARTGLKDKAWARKAEALGLGKGLVTGASAGFAAAGANAQGLANVQYQRANQQASSAGQMFGSAAQGLSNWLGNGSKSTDYGGYGNMNGYQGIDNIPAGPTNDWIVG